MLRGIAGIFTHRFAAPAWCAVAVGFALALGVSHDRAEKTETFLRARIAALATHDASQLQAELVSCRATVRSYATAMSASAPRVETAPLTTPVKATAGDRARMAADLARNAPAGFDVCARMESADQAVLRTLDRR